MKTTHTPTATQHTPGPWIASHRSIQDGQGGSQRWHILAGSDQSIQVCTLKGWDDEDEANARLIAAAPELLAALIACERQLDRETLGGEALDAARAAIAKAAA